MVTRPLRSTTSTIDIYIKLAQYPILSDRIRERMREEVFRRGIISEEKFEEEVEQLAQESQRREGLFDPYKQESPKVWSKRRNRIRAIHTDFYFAYNLPPDLFEQIIQEVLGWQDSPSYSPELAFNPEIAPWELLFQQGEIYERLPPPQREQVSHHLEEIKVVLIKGMISDQLRYIGVSKKVFSIADLRKIYERRIGTGKIGGKSAGMFLAWRILQQQDPEIGPDISAQVGIPESYFIGTDVIYEFRRFNNLNHLMNQKYRPLEEIKDEYPRIVAAHLEGKFPVEVEEGLREVLRRVENSPVVVRSSSLLEDNFGSSFAGKYQSYFCPNQGTEEENLEALLNAIRRVYASTLNPDAILYRRRHGLIDYDERMAILLQRVRGEQHGRYFFPTVAGVGFSQNPFRWHPRIRREDGFLRIVLGLGTRAVDRSVNDYPRMIALSHPDLRPEAGDAIRRYSQHHVDAIDLDENSLVTLPVREVLHPDFSNIRSIASLNKDDYVQEIISVGGLDSRADFVVTFNGLTKDRNFVKLMRTTLVRLEEVYQTPVDIEFTVEVIPRYPQPDYRLHILQCRPLSQREEGGPTKIPTDIPEEEILFRSYSLIPDGKVEGIRYIVYVDPHAYKEINSATRKLEVGRVVGRLNKELEAESFVLMGPGRWGSTNIDLGVRVGYADIYNTSVLIEMAVPDGESAPELSYGTHFFQDLVEDGIYSLPLHLDNPESRFDWAFFNNAPNVLSRILPADEAMSDVLKVIDIAAIAPHHRLSIFMDGSEDEALGYLAEGTWPTTTSQGTTSVF